MYCPDGSACASGQTCCLSGGSYQCCPVTNGVCCPTFCCPPGTDCGDDSCVGGTNTDHKFLFFTAASAHVIRRGDPASDTNAGTNP